MNRHTPYDSRKEQQPKRCGNKKDENNSLHVHSVNISEMKNCAIAAQKTFFQSQHTTEKNLYLTKNTPRIHLDLQSKLWLPMKQKLPKNNVVYEAKVRFPLQKKHRKIYLGNKEGIWKERIFSHKHKNINRNKCTALLKHIWTFKNKSTINKK